MKGLRSWFNEKQLNLLEKLNHHLTDDYDYSDDEIIEIIEAVENYLMMHGFEKDYVPNDIGNACESILDIFGTKT